MGERIEALEAVVRVLGKDLALQITDHHTEVIVMIANGSARIMIGGQCQTRAPRGRDAHGRSSPRACSLTGSLDGEQPSACRGLQPHRALHIAMLELQPAFGWRIESPALDTVPH